MGTFYRKERLINSNNIPADVLFILKKLKEPGFLSFLVGGCIRDLILNRPVRDWDFITDAQTEQIKTLFGNYKPLLIGKGFQTVTIILNHKAFQISSIGISNYQELSAKQNSSSQILKDNLMSRDFTINAISWNPDKGLVDPANGLCDLRNKIIRSINPDTRFKEDPLRMLRAIRIACELSFTMDLELKKSIYKNAFLIQFVSSERIREEISFILASSNAKQGVLLLCKYGLERYIFSLDRVKKAQFHKNEKNKLNLSCIDNLKQDLASQLALLGRLYYGSCEAARIFFLPLIKSLRFKKKISETVKILLSREWLKVDFDSDIKIRFLLAKFGEENAKRMMFLKKALLLEKNNHCKIKKLKIEEGMLKEELKKKHPVKLTDLAINGNDLLEMGLPEGERIGDILSLVLEKALINPDINNKDYLIKFVQSMINQSNGKI